MVITRQNWRLSTLWHRQLQRLKNQRRSPDTTDRKIIHFGAFGCIITKKLVIGRLDFYNGLFRFLFPKSSLVVELYINNNKRM
jgi:hypothetical protein